MTRDQALDVLRTGGFDQFIGVEENVEIEFKGAPYPVDTEAGKFELAKDASALANAQGGLIVIGVRTERDAERFSDVAVEVRPMRRELIDEGRYVDVLSDRIYPHIANLRVRFHASPNAEDRGLYVIVVPPQDDVSKYFVVQRPVVGEDRIPGWLVGVAIRSFGRVDEQRIGELHAMINRGLTVSRQLDDLAASVAAVHDRLDASPTTGPDRESPAERLHEVVEERLREITGE
jgi:predicted HTH transcriptional regulator